MLISNFHRIAARKLRPGGTIGIFASSSPVKPETYRFGIETMTTLGYRVNVPLDPTLYYGRYDYGFSCASIEDRVNALHELLNDSDVDVIIAARGGYGCLELLPSVNFEKIVAAKKLIIGYSDVTALLLPITGITGLAAVHGPTLASEFANYQESNVAKYSVRSLLSLITDQRSLFSLQCDSLRSGFGEGPLIGGNLTTLLTLLGTPWDVNYSGAILVLEDVGEPPYKIARALTQLKLAGKLSDLQGLVFGRFSKAEAKNGPAVFDVLRSSVSNMLSEVAYPVLAGLDFGHHGLNYSIPLGCRAQINNGVFSLLESPIA